ncbi:tail fiber protein [Flagellimonas sp. HMM57]|uniref:tail fiber protein n=1 Tax=unclassified Flagellimonas TaxID=2644544 RepID=UPI0013D79C5C|nr:MULTISPECIES: tail fiber protein [unclassified Flagellimonas]UII77356.1 tail fiber protein [Flagellimonas sp. HMM57]
MDKYKLQFLIFALIVWWCLGVDAQVTNTFPDDGNIGIGTVNPLQKLEIFNPNLFNTSMNSESQDHISFTSNIAGLDNFFGGITWKVGSRRRAAIAAVQEHTDSDHVGLVFFTKGTDGPGPMYESVRITRNGLMGIGTSSPDSKLTVKGKIHAEEVKVDISVPGPDYVFKEDYDLKSLEEVQDHIKKHGHLPNIPSAREMEENGIELGEMNMKLLEKIEELTLYNIQLMEKIENLSLQNEKHQRQLEKILKAIK